MLDQCGFQPEPLRRTTWSEKGTRPILKCVSRGPKFSVCGALALNPEQTQIRELFLIQERNYNAWDMLTALGELRREIGHDLIVVWDNLRAHHKIARVLREQRITGIEFVFLPPYAPELNPVEAMWSQCKYGQLANYAPTDKHALRTKVQTALQKQQSNQALLRSFFAAAQLPLPRPSKPHSKGH
jgi:DDE superfamily endonuclease